MSEKLRLLSVSRLIDIAGFEVADTAIKSLLGPRAGLPEVAARGLKDCWPRLLVLVFLLARSGYTQSTRRFAQREQSGFSLVHFN